MRRQCGTGRAAGRRTFAPTALAAVLAAGGALAAAAQDQPLFRSGTQIVDLFVTATDRDGRLVPDLLRDEFAIFDDGEPAEIVLFEKAVRPITVVVMLDTSASMDLNRARLMAGAEQFLIRMLPADRARVGAFNDKVEITPPEFVGDRDDLISRLRGLGFGNSTRVYDAAYASLDALTAVDGRRVILLFTDGDDTDSDASSRDVIDRAVADDVMIYSIGFESNYFNGVRNVTTRPDRNLKRFAEETGGGYFELTEAADLGPTFTRVAQELHSQYVLGFAPRRDGRRHEIDVRVSRSGVQVRTRRSYVSPPAAAAP